MQKERRVPFRDPDILDGRGGGRQVRPQADGREHAARGQGDGRIAAVEFRFQRRRWHLAVDHDDLQAGPGQGAGEGAANQPAADDQDIGLQGGGPF